MLRIYVITVELTSDDPIDSRDIKDALTEWSVRTGTEMTIPFVQVGRKE
jgi:hypothetical protein